MGVFGGSNGIESIIRYVVLLLLGMGAKLKTCGALAAYRETFIGDFRSLPTAWIRKRLMFPELSG